MSEWNLSVRLTGQGSDLSRTLRSTGRDARDASRQVGTLRRDIDRLRASARNDIRVRVRLDAGSLRNEVRTALAAAGTGQDLTVNLRVNRVADLARLRAEAGQTAHSLNVLQRAAREAKNELEELEGRAITTAAAIRRINTAAGRAQTRLDGLSGSTRTFRSDLDDLDGSLTRVGSSLGGLRGRVGGLNGPGGGGAGSGQSWLQGLLLLAPAAIPLVAGLSTSLAPLAGQFAAGGAAAAAFGIALAGQIEPLSEVADAEKKYQEAVREHGKASAEALTAQIKYQQLLAELPPDAQRAAIALSQLKSNFSDWSDDMARFTMTPLTKGITVLDQLIPRLTPHVQSASTQLERLTDIAGGAIQTPGFDAMADKFAAFTDRQLDEMTDKVIHFMRVISEGKAPGSGPIAEFIAYAKDNAPAAREALSAISAAVVTLLRAASEAGPSMLTLVTAAAKLVSALPPELVGIIIQVATALKLLQLSGAGFAALAGGLARVRTAITGLAAASTAAGGGVAGLAAAFATLGTAAKASVIVAGIAAVALVVSELMESSRQAPPDVDKLTTSLRELGATGKVTGEAAKAFGKDLDGLYDRVRSLTDPSAVDDVQQFIVTLGGLGSWDSTPVKDAKENIDAIDEALAGLVRNGQADLAAAALKKLTAEYGKGGRDTEQFKKELDGYKSALADAKFEQELAAESMGLFGQAAQDTQAKLEAQKASADGLRQSILALNEVNRAAGSAMSAFEQSIDDATEAAAKHAGVLRMRDGELDLGSDKAREAEKVLSDLAANTDAAATKAREQGKSWEYVQGIMTRGQDTFVQTAQKMGLTKSQAQALARAYISIPDKKSTELEMRTEDAISGLNSVQAAIKATPNAKSVRVDTLSEGAIRALEAVGLKTRQLPDGRTEVYTANGQALGSISAVSSALSLLNGKTANTYVNHHVTTYSKYVSLGSPSDVPGSRFIKKARGGVVDYYADGGIQRGGMRSFAGGAENHVAQFARAGTWRMWAEPETGGEAYIPLAMSKRVRSRAIAEETVRRLGGDPAAIQWNASGNVTDWRYDPQTGSLYSASDVTSAGNKTKKVKVKVKGKWQTKEVEYFDITAVEKKLKSAAKATRAWNADLQKVADRVGGDVAEALASMGKEGMKLADKMANGSTKYINQMAKALRDLQKTAKASLTDYTRQLGNANKVNKAFADDLAKLAAMGYGDLAAQLAEQNDTAAHQLADAASKDKKKAAKANAAAKTANNALTADQVSELVQIIAAIKTSKTGIHDVAATTGLGEDEIIAVANKAKSQISKSLGSRAGRFLSDLGKANKHMAYADGGLRAGIYATQSGIIRFAEPETRGEAYLPLSPTKRRTALPVLADVAHRFGLGLTDAQATRPIVIVRGDGDTHVNVTAVRTGATASDIGAQVGRSVRRARRGGVAARAA